MMLAEIQRGHLSKAKLDVLIYEAAQARYKNIIDGSLNEQAVIIKQEEEEVKAE